MHQLDVMSTFLNGPLEEVYVKQPPETTTRMRKEKEDNVYRLRKLYGLKQAPSA